MRPLVGSIEGEYRRYKVLAERAIEQLTDEQLFQSSGAGSNSVSTIMRHLGGNLKSRFSDFVHSDGEKPWRDRESEFRSETLPRDDLRAAWEEGWAVLFASLDGLDDSSLPATVTIRGVPLAVHEALHRSLAHASYHVGQIVFLAKALRGAEWRHLTIPPGGSGAYNRNPVREKPPGKE